MSSLPARVRTLAEEIAAAHGLEILEVRLAGGGRGRVLDVVVDADEPVGSDQTAQYAKELSRALDEHDPIRGGYTLQVGTPGLDRPLRTARDFRRQLGREVEVVLRAELDPAAGAPGGEGKVIRGVVRDVEGDTVTLESTGRRPRGSTAEGERSIGGEHHEVPLAAIDHGKVVLPW